MNQPTSTDETLSDKITYDDDYGCSEPEEVIRVVDVKEAVKNFKEDEKTLLMDLLNKKITISTYWTIRKEHYKKHFGEKLI